MSEAHPSAAEGTGKISGIAAPAPSIEPTADSPPPTTTQTAAWKSLPTVPADESRLRILMYHSVGWHTPRPGVTPKQLRLQLEWMRDTGVAVVPMSIAVEFLEGNLLLPRNVAVVTIDDGEKNGFTVAFPIFKEYSTPFTLGIATEAIEQYATRGTMQWSEIRTMLDSGLCEIASHSHTHRMMEHLPDDAVAFELLHSRDLLEKHLGVRPQVFFYPMGSHNARVRTLTEKAGYRAAFVAWGGPVRQSTRRFGLPRYSVGRGTSQYVFSRFFQHGD